MASFSILNITPIEYNSLAIQAELPLYGQYFWLEASVGKDSLRFYVIRKGVDLIALCPIYIPLSGVWLLPPCCQNGAIYFSKNALFKDCRRAMELLLETVGEIRMANIALPMGRVDALPYYWKGYQLRVRYNYTLCLNLPRKDLDAKFSRLVRRKVKAMKEEKCRIEFDVPFEDLIPSFYTFYKKKHLSMVHYEAFLRCAKASLSNGYGMTARLLSNEGTPLAVYFIGQYEGIAYSLATATVEGNSFANTALLYHILCELHQRGYRTFDFEGSMLQGVEPVFRSLGGEQHLFVEIQKGKLSLWNKFRLKGHYYQLKKKASERL